MGLLFTVGVAFIFLVGVPVLRWVALASIPLGLLVAALLYCWHKRKPVEVIGADDNTRLKLD